MPFARQTDVKEAIKEMFGMEPDELKAKLSEIDNVKIGIDEVKTLSSGQSGVLAEIKETLGKISTPYSQPNPNPNPNPNPIHTKELTKWEEDADGAFRDRTQPIINGILDTRAMIAKRDAIDTIASKIAGKKNGVTWGQLEKEINEKAEKCTIEQKANPNFWTNIYYLCLGEKTEEIERDRSAKSGRFYNETASSSIVVDPADSQKPEDKLNATQLNAAKKAGLSPAQYAKELGSMTVWGN